MATRRTRSRQERLSRDKLLRAYRERVKELNCLYGLSELIENSEGDPDPVRSILQGVAEILPVALLYPDIACARIVYEDRKFATSNFDEAFWRLSAELICESRKVGWVEVRYLVAKTHFDSDPFLDAERTLIDAVAERLGRCIERICTQQLRRIEQAALQQKDNALQEVLEKMKTEKETLGRKVMANLEKIVLPMLANLERGLSGRQRQSVDLLRQSLTDILSPFVQGLSRRFDALSPAETRICDHIRRGLSCKEVAALENISPGTVRVQRYKIRRKLGLLNKKINLQTFLGELNESE